MLPWMGCVKWYCCAASDPRKCPVGSVCPGPEKKGLGAASLLFFLMDLLLEVIKTLSFKRVLIFTLRSNEKNKVQ